MYACKGLTRVEIVSYTKQKGALRFHGVGGLEDRLSNEEIKGRGMVGTKMKMVHIM